MIRELEMKIIEYRKSGIGYKKIASLLGISKNTVASFCKRKVVDKDTASLVRYCRRCGNPFVMDKRHTNQAFCSHECKYDWWNEQRKSKAQIGKGGADNE